MGNKSVDDITDHTIITHIPNLSGKKGERQPYILFQKGPLMGKMLLLQEGRVTLGRSEEADITINDAGISRKHLKLEFKNSKTFAEDLGSTNGTFINGERITKQELRHEDKIQISSSTLIKYIYADKLDESTQQELYNMGHLDALTNAYNRRHFLDRLAGEFSFAERRATPLSLAFIDIDRFKEVNDTYGHPAGDFVLMRLAKLSRSVIREEDLFARFGGEEFILLLKGTDAPGAKILAERLRRLVAEHDFMFDKKKIPITISIGLATYDKKNFKNEQALIKAADKCLYESKHQGRNLVTCTA